MWCDEYKIGTSLTKISQNFNFPHFPLFMSFALLCIACIWKAGKNLERRSRRKEGRLAGRRRSCGGLSFASTSCCDWRWTAWKTWRELAGSARAVSNLRSLLCSWDSAPWTWPKKRGSNRIVFRQGELLQSDVHLGAASVLTIWCLERSWLEFDKNRRFWRTWSK